MKQAMGYSMGYCRASTKRRDVLNEFVIFARAICGLGTRVLAKRFAGDKEGWRRQTRNKSQARYQQDVKQPTAVKINAAKIATKAKVVNEEILPAGTLTEIRSISYLDERSRDLQQDSQQSPQHSPQHNPQQNLQQGLKQMLPALAGFCRQRWLVLVAPPCLPDAEDLKAAGIDPARVLVVHSGAGNSFDVLEQTLRSGTCGAVLAWLEKGDAATLARLRMAAEAGNAWGVLFRTARQSKRAQLQPAPLAKEAQLKMAMY